MDRDFGRKEQLMETQPPPPDGKQITFPQLVYALAFDIVFSQLELYDGIYLGTPHLTPLLVVNEKFLKDNESYHQFLEKVNIYHSSIKPQDRLAPITVNFLPDGVTP